MESLQRAVYTLKCDGAAMAVNDRSWLNIAVVGGDRPRPAWRQLRTFQTECTISMRLRPLYPELPTYCEGQPDGKV